MKKDDLLLKRTSAEILAELNRLSKLMDEYKQFISEYSGHMDKYLMRVKASFMADFYMGVEKIFEIIVEELNGGAPRGEAWHKRLLHTMTLEIKGVRPPVISDALHQNLMKFLGFRHVVRQAYGFQLDGQKMDELESIFETTWERFLRELKKFCSFLEGKR